MEENPNLRKRALGYTLSALALLGGTAYSMRGCAEKSPKYAVHVHDLLKEELLGTEPSPIVSPARDSVPWQRDKLIHVMSEEELKDLGMNPDRYQTYQEYQELRNKYAR